MSKCDTMRPGETLRLRDREGELEDITIYLRDAQAGRVRLATDASQRWIITRVPVGQERGDA